jgi:hypothetical protein
MRLLASPFGLAIIVAALFFEIIQRSRMFLNSMVLDDTNIFRLSRDNKNLEETINILLQEKKILEGKINIFQNEMVSLKKTLQTKKEKKTEKKFNII